MQSSFALRAKKNNLIKEHSSLSAICNVVTAQQRMAFNVLLYVARSNMLVDSTRTRFQVPLHILKQLTGIEAANNHQVKESVKGLMHTFVELNTLGQTCEWEWRAATLLADATIQRNGILEFTFSLAVLESIHSPSSFALLNPDIVKSLRSKYAIAFYEVGRAYLNRDWPAISIEDFRHFMCFKQNTYSNFADLRKRVIDPAIKEINSKTDLQIGYEAICTGKKVSGLKISVVETTDESIRLENIKDFKRIHEMLTKCLATDGSVKTE